MSIEEKVKSRALELGADFVGIAPRYRFEHAPEWARPENLLPDFRSVISYGIAMNRGALEAWFSKTSRRLLVLQNQLVTKEVDQIALHLSRWLERQGFKSVFVSQNGYHNMYRGRPDFSHKHAAMAAGLGRLGLSANFKHTQFGTAVHLCSVITEAELTPDPLVSDEDDPCHRCKLCLDICPAQAISRERTKSFVMEGREYSHQWVDKLRCAWGCGGLVGHQYQIGNRTVGTWAYNELPMSHDPYEFSTKFGAANHSRHPMELAEINITQGTEYCGNCSKVCIGTKKDNAALFKLHLNSGVVKIPEDPTLLIYLKSHNTQLEKWPIPGEEPSYKEEITVSM